VFFGIIVKCIVTRDRSFVVWGTVAVKNDTCTFRTLGNTYLFDVQAISYSTTASIFVSFCKLCFRFRKDSIVSVFANKCLYYGLTTSVCLGLQKRKTIY